MSKEDQSNVAAAEPRSETDTELTQVAQRHYDPSEWGGLTEAIVYAIAEARDVDPSEVKNPPLFTVIDAEALEETFFGPEVAGVPRQGNGIVEFWYTDYLVKVRSDGWILVFAE